MSHFPPPNRGQPLPYAPLALRTRKQWVCWRMEQRGNRPTKVPYNPVTGQRARANDPSTWLEYRDARAAWEARRDQYHGLGFVFNQDFTGVDLDHCVAPDGTIAAWAREYITRLDTYAERSPNDGIHLYVEGTIPTGLRRRVPGANLPEAAIEMYCSGRYFTVTGRTLPGVPIEIKPRQQVLREIWTELQAPTSTQPPAYTIQAQPQLPPVEAAPQAAMETLSLPEFLSTITDGAIGAGATIPPPAPAESDVPDEKEAYEEPVLYEEIDLFADLEPFTATMDVEPPPMPEVMEPEELEMNARSSQQAIQQEVMQQVTERQIASENGHGASAKVTPENARSAPADRMPEKHANGLSDRAVISHASRAKNGDVFRRLMAGDTSGYLSHSEADLALCGMLAFWVDNDPTRVDRLFRQSRLYRPEKWNRPARGGQTYGQCTVARVCQPGRATYGSRSAHTPVAANAATNGPRAKEHEGSELARNAYAAHQQSESDVARNVDTTPAPGEPERLDGRQQGAASTAEEFAAPALGPLPLVTQRMMLECLDDNEQGDARLFAHLFAGRCVYDHTMQRWYLWAGHYWREDWNRQVRRLVHEEVADVYLRYWREMRSVQPDAEDKEAEKLFKKIETRIWTLRALSRANHVLELAGGLLSARAEQWDRQPWLLGTADGVLDLRSGQMRPGRPEDYIRTIIPTRWRGLDVPAPRFEQFWHDIFADRSEQERAALIDFLQRVLGYGITGKVSEHIFLLFYGEEGRNGKDTLMNVLKQVLGEVVGSVSNDVLIASGRLVSPGAHSSHLCALQGKRIAWASETGQGARFDIGQVKYLTGGGEISARELYGKQFAFDPSHLLILLTNHKPHADASDAAFWERLCVVVFNQRFVDQPVAANERQRDTTLLAALEAEASGILAWLVRGCLAWQSHGLDIPDEVRAARQSYREEEDVLGDFLRTCCLSDPQSSVSASRLYERYKSWAVDNGMKAMSHIAFGLQMKRRLSIHKVKNGILYQGVKLAETGELGAGSV